VTLSDISIQRPILTSMMMLSLIVFGVLGYFSMGVDAYPRMEFPVVMVMARLEGASPEVIEEDVTDVLEEQLNTISGVRKISSTSSQGFSIIVVEFNLDLDLDSAAQDVRDKVARARIHLPRDVEPPVVDKVNPVDQPILWIPIQTDRTVVETSEFARLHLKPELETIPGVGSVVIFGQRDRNMRIWLDGEALRARGLAAGDVIAALRREHVEVPGGQVISQRIEYSVKTDAEFRTREALEGLVVAEVNHAPVLLRNVARVEDGSEDVRTLARFDGQNAVGLGIRKQPGANTVAIADEAYRRLDRLRPILPAGLKFGDRAGMIDFSIAIRESVNETLFSLASGALLATLTVWLFLRRWRATMIVGLAIPLSIVATFGVMWALGYTLNIMTLLALTLAVGVVVDDAIVVLENIERHRAQGEAPFDAATNATREIAFAATASTLSIAVVFLPVIFVTGIIGNFLREFGLTTAAAVLISLFVALTLTPMLAARVPQAAPARPGGIYDRLERIFLGLESGYRRALDWTFRHRVATLGFAGLSFVAAIGFALRLEKEFFPPEDQGRFLVFLETPAGTTFESTLEQLKLDEKWVLAQPEVAGLFSAVGLSGPRGPGTVNEGLLFATLTPRQQRKRSAQDLIKEAREVLGRIPGQQVNVFDFSSVQSQHGRGGFEFSIRGNLALAELDRLADELMRRLAAEGGIVELDKSLKLGLPELRVVPDREKASALGVNAQALATAVQAMIGGLDVATFKEGGHRFDIRVRLEEKDRAAPDAIERLYVRTQEGGVVELRNLVQIETGAAPSSITRTNRQRSVTISGNLEGKALSEAVAMVRRVAAEVLPEGVNVELSGEAEAMRESGRQFALMLALSVLVIYMILAAQFESLMHPLTVMLALPLALVGALGGLWLANMSLNLFSMIGIILLLGLVTKNSILLVDYANQLRREGMEKEAAMRKAAPIRMRPVLMTGISMIFGVLPAASGLGPGAESRQPMGVATGAGMLTSMSLTLLVVPVFYLVLDDFVDALKARLRRLLRRSPA
jgi:HAE1 family hydrophobic/amphiphilic exporter-1